MRLEAKLRPPYSIIGGIAIVIDVTKHHKQPVAEPLPILQCQYDCEPPSLSQCFAVVFRVGLLVSDTEPIALTGAIRF